MCTMAVLVEQTIVFVLQGSHVLPHELARRSLTLPAVLKNTLENTYFAQKQVRRFI